MPRARQPRRSTKARSCWVTLSVIVGVVFNIWIHFMGNLPSVQVQKIRSLFFKKELEDLRLSGYAAEWTKAIDLSKDSKATTSKRSQELTGQGWQAHMVEMEWYSRMERQLDQEGEREGFMAAHMAELFILEPEQLHQAQEDLLNEMDRSFIMAAEGKSRIDKAISELPSPHDQKCIGLKMAAQISGARSGVSLTCTAMKYFCGKQAKCQAVEFKSRWEDLCKGYGSKCNLWRKKCEASGGLVGGNSPTLDDTKEPKDVKTLFLKDDSIDSRGKLEMKSSDKDFWKWCHNWTEPINPDNSTANFHAKIGTVKKKLEKISEIKQILRFVDLLMKGGSMSSQFASKPMRPTDLKALKASNGVVVPVFTSEVGGTPEGGLDQQWREFQHAAGLARATGRALCLPDLNANKHKGTPARTFNKDGQKQRQPLSPHDFMDVSKLRDYVQLVPMIDCSRECQGRISGVWDFKMKTQSTLARLADTLRSFNFSIRETELKSAGNSINFQQVDVWNYQHMESAMSALDSSRLGRCAVAWHPHHALRPLEYPKWTITPKVAMFAKQVVEEIMGGEQFLAVHWQCDTSDPGDHLHRCMSHSSLKRKGIGEVCFLAHGAKVAPPPSHKSAAKHNAQKVQTTANSSSVQDEQLYDASGGEVSEEEEAEEDENEEEGEAAMESFNVDEVDDMGSGGVTEVRQSIAKSSSVQGTTIDGDKDVEDDGTGENEGEDGFENEEAQENYLAEVENLGLQEVRRRRRVLLSQNLDAARAMLLAASTGQQSSQSHPHSGDSGGSIAGVAGGTKLGKKSNNAFPESSLTSRIKSKLIKDTARPSVESRLKVAHRASDNEAAGRSALGNLLSVYHHLSGSQTVNSQVWVDRQSKDFQRFSDPRPLQSDSASLPQWIRMVRLQDVLDAIMEKAVALGVTTVYLVSNCGWRAGELDRRLKEFGVKVVSLQHSNLGKMLLESSQTQVEEDGWGNSHAALVERAVCASARGFLGTSSSRWSSTVWSLRTSAGSPQSHESAGKVFTSGSLGKSRSFMLDELACSRCPTCDLYGKGINGDRGYGCKLKQCHP